METLSFFSGIGGLELGIPEYVNVKCYCDINQYCKYLITKKFPNKDYYDDICTFPKDKYKNINLIMGGFPCQDISNAGKGKGLDGERSGLIWKLLDIIKYYKPAYIYLENVSNLKNKGLDKIAIFLDELGYDTRWCIIQASDACALHKRRRTFILSKNRSKNCNTEFSNKQYINYNWKTEPNIPRIINNPDKRRIKCLGNAVVPDQSRLAFHILCGKPNTNTINNIDDSWNNSLTIWKSQKLNTSNLPKYGSYINGEFYEVNIYLENKAIFPNTIQRFKTTHSLPTPTATDFISRKPTNTIKSRAFRPGVNKAVNLNRWIEMFPNKNIILPELDNEGYLKDNKVIVGIVPNPQWVEWLMGYPIDWTN